MDEEQIKIWVMNTPALLIALYFGIRVYLDTDSWLEFAMWATIVFILFWFLTLITYLLFRNKHPSVN